MTPVHAAILYAHARGTPDVDDVIDAPDGARCAASGIPLEGLAVPFSPGANYNDYFQMADDAGDLLHPLVAAVMKDKEASGTTGSGVASAAGFSRLLSNRERLLFLMDPPEPPFAVAIVNAQRQHVWWMARTSYDRDHIAVQFGHRRLTIDRPKAIAAARAWLDYEAMTGVRDGKPILALVPLSRDLKSPDDGLPTIRFQRDQSEEAAALRSVLTDLSMGDLWAAFQIRAAVRETRTTTPEAAVAAYHEKDHNA